MSLPLATTYLSVPITYLPQNLAQVLFSWDNILGESGGEGEDGVEGREGISRCCGGTSVYWFRA